MAHLHNLNLTLFGFLFARWNFIERCPNVLLNTKRERWYLGVFSLIYLLFFPFYHNSNYFLFNPRVEIFAVFNSCIFYFEMALCVLIPKTKEKTTQALIYLIWLKSLFQINNGNAAHNQNLPLFWIPTRQSMTNSVN